MKKFFVLLVGLLFFTNFCNAQKVMIPYDSFRDFLKNKYPSCFDSFDSLDITCSEIVNEDSLDIHGLGRTGLNYLSLEGIQYFTSLKYLNCTDNAIISSPPLPATLKFLNWSFNESSFTISLQVISNESKLSKQEGYLFFKKSLKES